MSILGHIVELTVRGIESQKDKEQRLTDDIKSIKIQIGALTEHIVQMRADLRKSLNQQESLNHGLDNVIDVLTGTTLIKTHPDIAVGNE